jgi:recombination DNA repair RAD52 pathway protein
MEPTLLISTGAVVVAIIFGVATHFRTKVISDLTERVAKVETKLEAFLSSQEKYNALILHRDDNVHRMDEVLDKLEVSEPVTEDESEMLAHKLEAIVRDPNEPAGKRSAAASLLSARKAREAE